MIEVLAIVVGVAVLLTLAVRSKRFRSKIRMVEGVWGFVRLWPNPGFRWKNRFQWSRFYGRGVR